MGDHLGTVGIKSNLRPLCQTKQSLVNKQHNIILFGEADTFSDSLQWSMLYYAIL